MDPQQQQKQTLNFSFRHIEVYYDIPWKDSAMSS